MGNSRFWSKTFDANIKRLKLIAFRIAMTIATTLEKHAILVFQNLPNNELKGIRLKFFEALPDKFDRQGYLKVARELSINDRTAER